MLWPFVLRVLAIGSFTYGGGYAMISALQQELVTRHAWLTPDEFSNSVAAGQITPGPLMLMVAFMGYKIAGWWGAVLGAAGLFLPSMVLVLILSRFYQRIQANPRVRSAMKGVNAAIVGLLAAAALDLAKGGVGDPAFVLLALGGFVLMGPGRQEPAWVMVGAGIVGSWLLR